MAILPLRTILVPSKFEMLTVIDLPLGLGFIALAAVGLSEYALDIGGGAMRRLYVGFWRVGEKANASGGKTRVFPKSAKAGQCESDLGLHVTLSSSQIVETELVNQANNEVVQRCHDLNLDVVGHARGIFFQGDVAAIV